MPNGLAAFDREDPLSLRKVDKVTRHLVSDIGVGLQSLADHLCLGTHDHMSVL